jgi:predicted dithiol-disulfide oxidoreductase (DUF899 family)
MARNGWDIPWYELTDEFDADFGVGEWHGHNAFIRDGEQIYRTYFVDARGDEAMGSTWNYLARSTCPFQGRPALPPIRCSLQSPAHSTQFRMRGQTSRAG